MRNHLRRIRRWLWRRVPHRYVGSPVAGYGLLCGVEYRKLHATASTTYTYTAHAIPTPPCERCGEVHDDHA